jgi:uncharacterized protein YacL
MLDFFKKPKPNIKILDSSVLVDGRISSIVKTGFIEGSLKIPVFILEELQSLADSSVMEKRKKGRNGILEVEKLKKLVNIEIISDISPEIAAVKEADSKLVMLCKSIDARLLTLDHNLNRIAKLQNVDVLNINELFNAIRPPYVIGDKITVKIVKPGERPGQGVGGLEDGTMVVVDGGLEFMDQKVTGIVRQVFQPDSGRMIFAYLAPRKQNAKEKPQVV